MKKAAARFFAALVLLFAAQGWLWSESWETLLAERVRTLAMHSPGHLEITIAPPTFQGTGTTSAFSRRLYYLLDLLFARQNAFTVLPWQSDMPTGTIEASYTLDEDGTMVKVLLSLRSPAQELIASTELSIHRGELELERLSIFPANIPNSAAASTWEALLQPLDRLGAGPLRVRIAANSETYTYYNGEALSLLAWSNQDCYIKIYHLNADRELSLIYPNALDGDNFLPGGQAMVLPRNSRFVFQEPFGQESILVLASRTQFGTMEIGSPPVRATGTLISRIAQSGSLAATGRSASRTAFAAHRFTVCALGAAPSLLEFQYPKPEDLAETILYIQQEIAALGGWLTGDMQDGSFSSPELSGSYRARGDTVFLTLERFRDSSLLFSNRGRAEPLYRFSFERPQNITEAVKSVRDGIIAKGGLFAGDEQRGNFQASGITGEYQVAELVNVTIIDKPFVIPNRMIEKEVKNYFGVQ